MRAGSLVLPMLVLAAVVLGGSSQAQVVQYAARTGTGTGPGAGTGMTPSPPPTLTSVVTRLNSVVLAVRLWFVALFRFIHELMPWCRDHGSTNAGFAHATFPSNLEWNGVCPSQKELESMVFVKDAFLTEMASGKLASTTWLQSVSDREILRFVRHHNGNKDAALKSIKAHAQWRASPLGSETLVRTGQARFGKSALNKEVFWLGVSKAGCPTLVVRTRAHDGKDYNEDPKIFSRCVASDAPRFAYHNVPLLPHSLTRPPAHRPLAFQLLCVDLGTGTPQVRRGINQPNLRDTGPWTLLPRGQEPRRSPRFLRGASPCRRVQDSVPDNQQQLPRDSRKRPRGAGVVFLQNVLPRDEPCYGPSLSRSFPPHQPRQSG